MTETGVRWFDHDGDLATWMAHPDEFLRRASHVLTTDDGAYLVEPVRPVGPNGAQPGDIAGVIVLMDRHWRDATFLAAHHGVSLYLPSALNADPAGDLDVRPAEPILEDAGFDLRSIGGSLWDEVALWRSRDRTLVVPETVGTAPYFHPQGTRVGVHWVRRFLQSPDDDLAGRDPARLLVGHGPPIDDLERGELADAFDNARRGIPPTMLNSLRGLL